MAGLSIDGKKRLKVEGTPPYDCTFTVKLAEAVLSLPPVTTDGQPSATGIIMSLSPKAKRSFETLVKLDKKLTRLYADLTTQYSMVLTGTPHQLQPADIVEEIIVDCPPIAAIVFTISGVRYVSESIKDYSGLMTFDEFKAKYHRSVADHIEYTAKAKIRSLMRVRKLIKAKPIAYEVDFVTDDVSVYSKRLFVYSKEQIQRYADRAKATVTNITQVKPE